MPLTAGSRLGPYEIVSSLGAGGMGEVYRAMDTRLDRVVAIKVLPAHLSSDASLRERFDREARAISQLTHPHICTLHDVGRHDDVDFLVMEYLEGETLDARVARGPLPLEDTLRIGIQIAQALERAHRSGIVHRDLKPGNVMLTKSGAKLLDFGLARIGVTSGPLGATALPTSPAPLTQHGAVLGTFHYMAPEQLEGREADARSDIFAFGALVYEMAAGRRAFDGASQASLIAAILERHPPALSSVTPAVPMELERVVSACLAKNPDDRLQTMHDVRLQLEWVSPVRPASVSQGLTTGPRAAAARSSLTWLLATLAIAVAAAAAGWFLRTPPVVEPVAIRFTIEPSPGARLIYGNARTNFAVTPDGNRIAYVVDPQSRIYVRSLSEFEGQALAGTEDSGLPFFSPDGQWLGFLAGATIKRISVAGGTPQPIGPVLGRGMSGAPTWLADGTIVWATQSAELMRLAPGGQPEVLLQVPLPERPRTPFAVTDVVLFSVAGGGRPPRIEALNVTTGARREILASGTRPQYINSGHLLYVEGNTLLAVAFDLPTLTVRGSPVRVADALAGSLTESWFGSSPTGTVVFPNGLLEPARSLVWVDRRGVEQPISSPKRFFEQPRISPDGSRIAIATRELASQDVGVIDPQRGTFTRLSFGASEDETPVWTPDGRRVIYKNASWVLASKAFDGSSNEEPLPLTETLQASNPHVASISPDGRYVIVGAQGASTGEDLMVVSVDGSAPPRPFLQTPFQERAAAMSPDGKWIAYSSNESGRFEIYVQAFPGPGGKWQVSVGGGTEPVWARNGREIFYRENRKMMAVAVQTTAAFSLGVATTLFEGDYGVGHRDHPDYDVAPDGRFLMMKTESGPNAWQLRVITNLGAELLKQRAP